jgi:hypothetical protein
VASKSLRDTEQLLFNSVVLYGSVKFAYLCVISSYHNVWTRVKVNNEYFYSRRTSFAFSDDKNT